MKRLYQKKVQIGIVCAIIGASIAGGYLAHARIALAPPIHITHRTIEPSPTQEPLFVAHVRGSVYYVVTCAGAERINERNKRFFFTREEAEARGYRPSARCDEIFLFP